MQSFHVWNWSFIALLLWVGIVSSQDSGSVENCGDESASKFSVTWSPRKVKIGDTTTIDLDFTASTILNELGNSVCFTVWMVDTPDPILPRQCSGLTCSGVHKYIDFIPCPMKSGDHFSKSKKVFVDPSYPIPTGDYILKAEIFNANGTMFLCAKAHVIFYED